MTSQAGGDHSSDACAWPEAIARLRAAWPDLPADAPLERARQRASSASHVRLASDDDLLAWGCLLGSGQAAQQLDERCLRPVLPRLRGMGFRPDAIDDLVADVRVKLLDGGGGDRAPALARHQGRGSLAGYVRAIAVRHAIDLLRHQRSAAGKSADGSEEIDEIAQFTTAGLEAELTRQACADAVTAAFRRAWGELPAHQRLLLTQQVIDRLSVDELGAIHGVHRATASRRCISARETLLARLRAALHETLGVHSATADSILRNAGSQLSGVLGLAIDGSDAPDPHPGQTVEATIVAS